MLYCPGFRNALNGALVSSTHPLAQYVTMCREKPSLPDILKVLVDVCEHLREVHACGYVYYALKPSNIVWLQAQSAWQLADFGCASRSGAPSCPCCCTTFSDSTEVSPHMLQHILL
jgi:hypothetical protein